MTVQAAGGVVAGTSSSSGSAALIHAVIVGIAGVATVVSNLGVQQPVDSDLEGEATVFAAEGLWGSGTAAGTGSLADTQPVWNVGLNVSAAGSSSLSAVMGNTLTSTAYATGFGTFQVRDTIGSGVAAGTSTTSATSTVVTHLIFGTVFRGSSLLVFSEPEPMRGNSSLSAFMQVETEPLSVCAQARLPPPKSFRWGQLLQRGDLAIYLREVGFPRIFPYAEDTARISPQFITYTYYQVRGQALFQVGPAEHVPARGDVGEFYATGTIGRFGGQPGNWVIRWRFQKDCMSPVQCEDYSFSVQDAVAANDPRDQTCRVRKFGWT